MSSLFVRLVIVCMTLCAVPLLSFTVLFSSDFLVYVVAEDQTENMTLDVNICKYDFYFCNLVKLFFITGGWITERC